MRPLIDSSCTEYLPPEDVLRTVAIAVVATNTIAVVATIVTAALVILRLMAVSFAWERLRAPVLPVAD